MGPDMERIAEIDIQEKMSILSSLNTLTVDIQKILQSWMDFQHHLEVTAPAIVEVCVQKDRPSDFTSHKDQAQNNDYLNRQGNFWYLPISSG